MMNRGLHPIILAAGVALVAAWPGISEAAFMEFAFGGNNVQGTGNTITPTVTNFRNALGMDNDNILMSLPGGRREINWDGGGTATSPSATPLTAFLNNRGALLTNPLPPSPPGSNALLQVPAVAGPGFGGVA